MSILIFVQKFKFSSLVTYSKRLGLCVGTPNLNGIRKNSLQVSQLKGMGLWKVKKLYNLQSVSMKIEIEQWIEDFPLSPHCTSSNNT